MNRNDASELATRIAQTWPRGVSAQVWEEELADMDAGKAGTAFAKMRRSEVHSPSVATFWSYYRAQRGDAASADACPMCGGSGWVPPPDAIEVHGRFCGTRSGAVCDCRGAATPCRCGHGERATEQTRRWAS